MAESESRLGRFLEYQRVLARQRHVSFNAPWRVFIIVVSALLLYYAWSVLHFEYTGDSIPLGGGTIGDLLFNWFFYGMIIGAALFAFLFEGEYIIGVWRLATRVSRAAAGGRAGTRAAKGARRGR